MTDRDILIRARALVARGWTQRTNARDETGRPTDPRGPDAVCWCLSGAVHRVAPDAARHAYQLLCKALDSPWAVDWNDTPGRTQAEVLELFDRAIARLIDQNGGAR